MAPINQSDKIRYSNEIPCSRVTDYWLIFKAHCIWIQKSIVLISSIFIGFIMWCFRLISNHYKDYRLLLNNLHWGREQNIKYEFWKWTARKCIFYVLLESYKSSDYRKCDPWCFLRMLKDSDFDFWFGDLGSFWRSGKYADIGSKLSNLLEIYTEVDALLCLKY